MKPFKISKDCQDHFQSLHKKELNDVMKQIFTTNHYNETNK